MGTQGPGRKRIPNQDKLNAEDDALSQIAREAEARLAAKRAARAEAREIRMKELERQQKELFHSHKKYYGLDYKWGHIEQWMEESERYSGLSRRHASISDDEERMSVGSRGSLRPSDYGGLLGSSSRTSSRASSARASPVVEERTDREFFDKGSRTASTLSATTLASLGGASSRRGSCDTSISIETEASIRDMKDSLVEAEEKYRRAMVSNAQLHNDKTTLMFQVETLREELGDLEELLWEARRHCDNCNKELERERQAHRVLQLQFTEMKETLRRTEGLLTEVSDLRMKSSSFRQEVSDLQEALQWKEKKIEALERHRETSDRVQMDRDRLRDQVVRLRDLLKKHGALVSPDVATNGDAERSEDDVSTEPGCRLAKECPGGGGESPGTGKTEDLQDSFSPRRASKQSHPLKTSWTSDRSRPAKGGQSPGDRTPTGSSRTKRDTTRKLLQNQPVLTPDQDSKDLPRPDSGGVEGERHDSTVSVCTASSEKVLRSRLVPPRPAEEMILVNRAVVLSLLTAEGDKQKPVLEKKASCSVGVSAGPDGGKTQEILNQTLGNSLKEHEPGRGDVTETNPCSAVSEARLRPEEVPSSLMEKSGSSADFQTQMILKAVQGTAEAHRGLPELPESKIAAFVPEEIQTGLEETVQDMLRGLADKPGLVVEISRIFSEMLTSLHRWTSGLENSVGNESRLFDGSGPEPTRTNTKSSHLLDRTRQTESPGGPEGSLVEPAGEPSGSTGKVRPDVQDQSTTNDREDVVHSRRGRSSSEEESGLSPAEETLSGKKPSEDFVFVDSYFSEPLHTMMESKSDPGPSQSEPGPSQSESHPVGSGKELRSSGASVSSNAGQSSAVKRLIEMTTEELKAIAVPELVLLNLQEGRRLDESSRPNHGSLEDVSPGHVDSCEEAGEEELLQPVSEHQTPSRMEAGDLKVLPTVGRDKPEGKHEGTSRRDENMDCRLS